MRTTISTLTLVALLACAPMHAKDVMLQGIPDRDINPEGWVKTMLTNQRDHFSGVLDTLIYPFAQDGWGSDPYTRKMNGKVVGFWVPFEQAAYYCDGLIRCGYLLDDKDLTGKAENTIRGAMATASPEGIINPSLSAGDRRRWPHAVFFRAMMAYYENSHDPSIIEAMEKHFLNDTIPLAGRDRINVEAMAWLYGKTGNKALYEMAMDVLDNVGFSQNHEDEIGDYGSDHKQEIHGVTYNEMLKLPIMKYILTGKKSELDKARNGFAKLDKWHMLPDGVNSSEEGVSGNGSQNTHETCNVVDYMWTCLYMLKITRETEWADRIERALFNAGMGSITKTFDAHQYYSCPNQVFCNDHSCHVLSYPDSRLAYRQAHTPPCCTGNINRMLPIFTESQWLTDSRGSLYKAVYGPGSVTFDAGTETMVISEESVYPYSDEIRISISEGAATFPFYLRIPGWCKNPSVAVNGTPVKGVKSGKYLRIKRAWRPGDEIILNFPKEAEFINWNGFDAMVVNYGPLLFALPVKASVEKKEYSIPAFKNMPYFGYTMTPESDWNYIIGVDGSDNSILQVVTHDIDATNPWIQSPQAIQIRVPMYQDPTWKEWYHKYVDENGNEAFAAQTPPLPTRGAMIFVLRKLSPEMKTLVPYGSTCLRISMFPFWQERAIAPEVLATEDTY